MKYLLLSLVLVCHLGCHPQKQLTEKKIPDLIRSEPNIPQVVLVIFEITDNGQGNTPSAAIINKQISPGKIKRNFKGNLKGVTNNHFTINFLDKNNKTITSHHVSNPLTENVEYVNDDGELARKEIQHQQKEIIMKSSLPDNISHIELVYNQNNGKALKLSSLRID